MSDAISAIDSYIVATGLYTSLTTKHLTALTSATKRRLEEYGINTDKISSEEEAVKILKAKDAEKTEQTAASKNAESYYDKQIMSDAIELAEDLGIYVGSDMEIETLMDNIRNRLTELTNTVGNNENTKKVVDEYSNRYDYIYAQYMNKKNTLSTQIITSLDAMSINAVTRSSI